MPGTLGWVSELRVCIAQHPASAAQVRRCLLKSCQWSHKDCVEVPISARGRRQSNMHSQTAGKLNDRETRFPTTRLCPCELPASWNAFRFVSICFVLPLQAAVGGSSGCGSILQGRCSTCPRYWTSSRGSGGSQWVALARASQLGWSPG